MALLARKKLLLAKIETTYGTDSTPTGAANAIQTSNFQITPLDGPTTSRNLDSPYLGNDVQIQVGSYVTVTFDVEFAGSGSGVDEVPAYGPLLEACGFDETVVVSTNVIYSPSNSDFESLTMYAHLDGQLHSITGARGSVAMSLSPGGIPQFSFTFMGLFNTPSSDTDPTPVFTAFATPVPVNNTNTTTATLHGETLVLRGLSLDVGNEVAYQNVVNSEAVDIIDRAVSGSISFDAPAISDKDWFTTAINSTTGNLTFTHGTTAGNIVTVTGPATQVISPTYGEASGIRTIEASLSLINGSGSNDIVITTS